MCLGLLDNLLEVTSLSDVFKQLERLAYETGLELSILYGNNLDVIVSEKYMAFLVLSGNAIVFAYRIGDVV